MKDVCRDTVHETVWVFGDEIVYQLVVNDSEANVWKDYLSLGNYEMSLCYVQNDRQKSIVIHSQADDAFQVIFMHSDSFYYLTLLLTSLIRHFS